MGVSGASSFLGSLGPPPQASLNLSHTLWMGSLTLGCLSLPQFTHLKPWEVADQSPGMGKWSRRGRCWGKMQLAQEVRHVPRSCTPWPSRGPPCGRNSHWVLVRGTFPRAPPPGPQRALQSHSTPAAELRPGAVSFPLPHPLHNAYVTWGEVVTAAGSPQKKGL